MKKNEKDKEPKNSKGQHHGYQEWYFGGNLWVRCNLNNGLTMGYTEVHSYLALSTNFHIR
jgi:hypothetical protein